MVSLSEVFSSLLLATGHWKKKTKQNQNKKTQLLLNLVSQSVGAMD